MKSVPVMAVLLIAGCAAPKTSVSHAKPVAGITVAHRGAFKKNNHPENSVAALKEAIRLGCAGSEFDVRMTADDSLIINHDPHYHGLEIEKNNYVTLLQYKLANGEKLPTLQEYIAAGTENNPGTKLVCEIKPSGMGKERAAFIAAKTVALFRQLQQAHRVIYISFDYEMLKKILELSPGAITQYLNGEKTPEQLKADGIAGADYHISVFRAHPDWIPAAKKLGIALNAWTVNAAGDLKWLLDQGFDFITTNEPELLMDMLKQRH